MKLLDKKDIFYNSLDNLPLTTDDLDKKRSEIKKIVLSFNQSLQKITPDKNLIKKNKQLGDSLAKTINQIKAGGSSWVNNYQAMEEREKFRSDLANYFIIIIFGKVNAGKSSLGNFIAKQKLPTQEVSFFKYDEAGKEITVKELEEVDDSFATNNLECTAEIQGFKLGSLAWIDTPGLSSMTKENGDLAKEYIQAADYIIYPTSSDSPLQRDETKQLEELFAQNKKVTICITRSDDPGDDQCACGSESGCENCDGGIVKCKVNKSVNNREVQENDVKKRLIKIIPTDRKEALLGEIFSMSVHTAERGLEQNNEELYENSNLPIFYDQVTDVFKNKAADLKKATPYDGLKAFINKEILGLEGESVNSIKAIKNTLSDLDEKISESLQRFADLQNNTQNDMKSILDEVLTRYSSEINQSNLNDILRKVDKEVGDQVSKELQKNITEIFSDFETSLDQFTESLDSEQFEINDKYKEVSYTTKVVNKKIGAGLLGLLATVGVGIITGGSSLVVQGLATTAAGIGASYAGGKVGEAMGSTKTTNVNVGDNKEEVLQEFKAYREEVYSRQVNTVYQQLQDDFFEPLKEVSKTITNDIKHFEKKLEIFKESLC